MKMTNRRELSNAVRKAGLELSRANMSGRVKGWCSSIREGVDIGEVYPWVTRYTRKGRYFYSYITDAHQEVRVKWQSYVGGCGSAKAEEASAAKSEGYFKQMLKALDDAGIEYELDSRNAYSVNVWIENPNKNAAELDKKENERMQAHRLAHR